MTKTKTIRRLGDLPAEVKSAIRRNPLREILALKEKARKGKVKIKETAKNFKLVINP